MTDEEMRGKLLKVFCDLRHTNGGWVPTSEVTLSGVDQQIIGAVCQQLEDGGLILWKPVKGAQEGFVIGLAKITAIGVDVVNGLRKPPIAIQFGMSFLGHASPAQTAVADNKTSGGEASLGSAVAIKKQRSLLYDVALSFAGEDREYVAKVANLLRDQHVEVFYDAFEEARLWGKNLYEYLTDVYRHRAQFTVVFISEAYGKKLWTNHERKAAQARAFEEAKEYILPARFDDTEIPGILPTTGYISLRDRTPEQLVAAILSKLGRIDDTPEPHQAASGPPRLDVGEVEGGVGVSVKGSAGKFHWWKSAVGAWAKRLYFGKLSYMILALVVLFFGFIFEILVFDKYVIEDAKNVSQVTPAIWSRDEIAERIVVQQKIDKLSWDESDLINLLNNVLKNASNSADIIGALTAAGDRLRNNYSEWKDMRKKYYKYSDLFPLKRDCILRTKLKYIDEYREYLNKNEARLGMSPEAALGLAETMPDIAKCN